MRSHRLGRTGTAGTVTRETHARLLLGTLRNICRQLRRANPDGEVRRAYLGVEKDLAELMQRTRTRPAGRNGR